MRILLTLTGILFFLYAPAIAQQKSILYQIEANALINNRDAAFKSGAGLTAGVFFPLSPSFNLGPAFSADRVGIQNSVDKYNPVSARLTLIYFPEKLLNKLLENPNWASIYLKAGVGHSFNYAAITNKQTINSAYFDLAFMLPLRNRTFNIHAGITTFALNKSGINVAGSNNGALTTIGIGYNWFKFKNISSTR
jgi:hypothetical protein